MSNEPRILDVRSATTYRLKSALMANGVDEALRLKVDEELDRRIGIWVERGHTRNEAIRILGLEGLKK